MLDMMASSKNAASYVDYIFYLDCLIVFLSIYFMVLMAT